MNLNAIDLATRIDVLDGGHLDREHIEAVAAWRALATGRELLLLRALNEKLGACVRPARARRIV
jgi:hypothetical protein